MSNSIGNLKNSGLQGNNFPWQLKMLQGLQAIYDATSGPLTCVDQVTVCGTSFTEIDDISALNVNVVNPIPLEVVIDEQNDSILIYGFDGTDNQPISVDTNGNVNIRQLDCGDKVSVCFKDGVNDITVSTTNPLPVDATVTIDLNANTDQVGIYGYQDINDPTTPTAISVDVDGHINVNATIDCTTSSIAICDGTPGGSNLLINNPGSPADGSINTVLVDLTTGSPAVINPDGTQNNAVYGYDHSTMQNEQITSTNISSTVQALDVNISNTVATAGASSAPVGMYGSTDLGTNWTAVAVDTFGVVSTNANIAGPLGIRDCDEAVSVALCDDQNLALTAIANNTSATTRTPNILLATSGTALITVPVYSITFFNQSPDVELITFDGGSNYVTIQPGLSITMDAGGNNTYPANSFGYDIIGTGPILITYNS